MLCLLQGKPGVTAAASGGPTGRRRLRSSGSSAANQQARQEEQEQGITSELLMQLLHAEVRAQQAQQQPVQQRRRRELLQQAGGDGDAAPGGAPGGAPAAPGPPPPAIPVLLSEEALTRVDSTGGSIFVVTTTGLELNSTAIGEDCGALLASVGSAPTSSSCTQSGQPRDTPWLQTPIQLLNSSPLCTHPPRPTPHCPVQPTPSSQRRWRSRCRAWWANCRRRCSCRATACRGCGALCSGSPLACHAAWHCMPPSGGHPVAVLRKGLLLPCISLHLLPALRSERLQMQYSHSHSQCIPPMRA